MKQLYSFCVAILFFVCNSVAQSLSAQTSNSQLTTINSTDWVTMMQDGHSNFYDIQKAFNKVWLKKEAKMLRKLSKKKTKSGAVKEEEEEMPGGYMIYKRWEDFWKPRVYPTGQFPSPSIASEEFQMWKSTHSQSYNPNHSHQTFSVQAVSNWSLLGPSTVPANGSLGFGGVGRINSVRFDPTNSNIVYVGGAAGGLWKSTTGGTNWSTSTDNLQVLGVSDVVVDPTNTNIIYIATGDGDAGDTYSVGVLKSIDGGATWNTTGLNFAVSQTYIIRKLIMHPTNDSILLASTNGGVFKTTNAGNTWTEVLAGSYRDLVFNTGDPTIVYAGGYGGYGYYKSTNTGASFTAITSGLPAASGTQRIAIGVTANDATYVYLLISNNTNYGLLGVYRSTDSGTTFSTQTGTSPNLLGWAYDGSDVSAGGQGWYDLCIAVNPANKNDVYTGGINQWRSQNGGVTWTSISVWDTTGAGGRPYVHADVHSLGFLPGSSTTLFSGNDGGVFTSTNNGTTWTDLSSGLTVTEMYRLSTSATNANLNISGNQDNGTTQLSSGSWSDVVGGDGMECIIDYTNANIMYGEIYYGAIYKSTTGGGGFGQNPIISNSGSGVNAQGDWVTPYVINPVTHTTLLVGKAQVYQSTNSGSSWTTLGSISGGSGSIIAIAYAPSATNTIYAAKTNALFVTTNGGTSWTNISSGLPTASVAITYIAVDPANAARVWVTFSGYSAGNKVFFSNNTGSTWTNFSGSLPNLPVDCIAFQNSTSDGLYIGTDVGAYYRDASLSDWTGFMTGLPNVIVNDLSIQYSSGKIRAATYGRGMWESALNTTPSNTLTTGTISPLTYCAGTIMSVPYTVTGTYGAGNVFTAQLSNATGSFASPVNIGTLTSSVSGTISATIPSNTAAGTGYRIRVVSSSPSLVGTTNVSNITVNAAPSATASSNSPVCAGNTVNLSSTGGGTYSWNGPNSFTSASQNPTIANSTTAATGTYTVTVSNGGTCSTIATVAVTVNAKPTPSARSNTPVCVGYSINLSSSGGTSYSWNGPNSFTSTTQNPIILGVTTAAAGTYSVTVTNASGCTATTTTSVTVTASPFLTISSNSPVCAGNTVNLSLSGGATYSWSGPNSFTSTLQNPTIANSTTAASGTYSVIVTTAIGCTATTTTSVTVNSLPSPTASSNSPVCMGNNLNLSSSGGISYFWNGPNSFTSTSQNPIITTIGGATVTYTVTVTNASGCTATATTLVIINFNPFPTASSNTPVCAGNNLNLSSTGGTSYSWSGPNSFTSTNQNPIIVSISSGTYTVIVTNTQGCTATATTSVTVNANPIPSASSNSPVCSGNNLNLSGSGGVSYSWSGPNSFASTIQNPIIVSVTTAATGTYIISVVDNNGCTGSASTSATINNCSPGVLNLTLFLQGFYIPSNTMRATLYNLNLSTDSTATDSILINLWLQVHLSNTFPDYSLKTILHKNGSATASFSSTVVGNSYYIAIKHRNTVETWSHNPVTFSTITSYNFSTSLTQAYSNGINTPMKNMGDGVYALYSGDDNQDGTIDAGDMSLTDNDSQHFAFGYNATDCNGDGATGASDLSIIDNNSQLFLFYARP